MTDEYKVLDHGCRWTVLGPGKPRGKNTTSVCHCRWATSREQAINKSSNVRVKIAGETKTLSEWSLSIGGHRSVIYNRYRRGVRGDKLLEPVRVYRKSA